MAVDLIKKADYLLSSKEEDGGLRTEDGGQKTEDGGQKTEYRAMKQNSELQTPNP